MNGRKCKRLRKQVYGDMSIRGGKHFINPKTGVVVADKLRRAYQKLKKEEARP